MFIKIVDWWHGHDHDAQDDYLKNDRHNGKDKIPGLGLPLSEALAQSHGGKLNLRSSPNVGTTVSLVLPATRIVDPARESQRKTA